MECLKLITVVESIMITKKLVELQEMLLINFKLILRLRYI